MYFKGKFLGYIFGVYFQHVRSGRTFKIYFQDIFTPILA